VAAGATYLAWFKVTALRTGHRSYREILFSSDSGFARRLFSWRFLGHIFSQKKTEILRLSMASYSGTLEIKVGGLTLQENLLLSTLLSPRQLDHE
jgi:hypothetical protein